ncbi:ricin-type beta-trefoil lectin domain protein [Streptomyces murinus]|uniref:ricin-type beta-trefoil lectin domain protein n=1 Tax=Streptomyces murinus TaxID=33900 RepID=UPI003D67AA60
MPHSSRHHRRSRAPLAMALDVTDGSTADGTPAQMWSCAPGPDQSWTLNDDGFLTALGKCLDLVNNGTGDGTAVHMWTCYSPVSTQEWSYAGSSTPRPPTTPPPTSPSGEDPDLGPNTVIFLKPDDGGWSSGGFISDSKIDGQIQSGSQQQFLAKNSRMGFWSGSNWNMVFVGDQGAPGQSFPTYTNVPSAPVDREKPYLYIDGSGAWQVLVPATQTNASATTWSGKTQAQRHDHRPHLDLRADHGNGSTDGYPAYKVADSVTSHEAWSLGSYAYFNVNPSVVEDHAFEVPQTPGVKFHDMVTVVLGGAGTITHIVNCTGATVTPSNNVAYLTNCP